jgi:hypothetical protein
MRVERRLKGSGSKGTVWTSEWLYINGRAPVKVSHHFHEKFSVQDPVSGFVSFPVPVGVEFRSLGFADLQISKEINGPLPHLSEKEIPPIALTQPHFIPPLFFLDSLLSPARLSPLRPPVPPVRPRLRLGDAELRQCTVLRRLASRHPPNPNRAKPWGNVG